jgi:hypothetical protein
VPAEEFFVLPQDRLRFGQRFGGGIAEAGGGPFAQGALHDQTKVFDVDRLREKISRA